MSGKVQTNMVGKKLHITPDISGLPPEAKWGGIAGSNCEVTSVYKGEGNQLWYSVAILDGPRKGQFVEVTGDLLRAGLSAQYA